MTIPVAIALFTVATFGGSFAATAVAPRAVKPVQTEAKWIWSDAKNDQVDTYRLFRKSFELKSKQIGRAHV